MGGSQVPSDNEECCVTKSALRISRRAVCSFGGGEAEQSCSTTYDRAVAWSASPSLSTAGWLPAERREFITCTCP